MTASRRGAPQGRWVLAHRTLGLLASGVLLAVGLAACGGEGADDGADPTSGPFDAEAEMRPDLLELDPDEVGPGATITMHFPEETSRGVAYVLEEEVGDSWELRYLLTAAEDAGAQPSWWPVEERDDAAWPDVGLMGPGPNWIQIPHTADPGSYRVCTANAGDEFCAPLEVTE